MRNPLFRSFLIGVLIPTVLLAGKLTTNDGTVYEGEITKTGGSYKVRTSDGALKLISGKDVKSIDDPTVPNPAAGPAMSPAGPGGAAAPAGSSSADFTRIQHQAEKVDTPVYGVALWQTFIDAHKGSPDLPAAQKELTRWQEMVKNGAEKINGKWVVGEDLKKLQAQVNKTTQEALRMIRGDQAIQGVKKLEEVLKLYPQAFVANFEMGYYYLIRITRVEGSNAEIAKSLSCLLAASKVKPNSPATLSNLAIAYSWSRKYEDSVLTAYKAAQLQDSDDIVQNLVTALEDSPPGMMRNDPKIVAILPDAKLVIGRHSVKEKGGWLYIRRNKDDSREGDKSSDATRHGVIGTGSGYFITDTGYILTNRHVAAEGDKLIVRTSDGTTKVAERVVIDDDQDIAVLKIKPDKPVPFIHIATYDEPAVGADVTVMGFPLGDVMGQHVKLTRGIVTSVEADTKDECDVIVDAQVNPGNSGGPMLDKHGNLMAMTSMKTLAIDESISSYGLGIGTARIRTFIQHQKDKLAAVKLMSPETKPNDLAMNAEDIAAKYTPATVMILCVAGESPEGLK